MYRLLMEARYGKPEKLEARRESSPGPSRVRKDEEDKPVNSAAMPDHSTVRIDRSISVPVSNNSSIDEDPASRRSSNSSGELSETSIKVLEQTGRLSDVQRQIIIRTFKKMHEDALMNGLKIFVRLFSEKPNYKQIWPQFRQIPDSALTGAPELRRHATIYMGALKCIIGSMDDDEQLTRQFNKIALAHIKHQIHKSHLMAMVEPVLDVVKESNGVMDEDIRRAWVTMYDVIANLIEIFREKQRQRAGSRAT